MSGHKKWSEIKHKGGDRHVTEDEVLQTYTLQLIGPFWGPNAPQDIPPQLLRETEENLSDLLPPGYSVRIEEWDA